MTTEIEGKKGTVNITAEGEVRVIDNSKNSNYVVKNKKDNEHYGYNTFEFTTGSGTDTIKGFDSNDKITFTGVTEDMKFSKKGTSNDLVITKNNDKDKITLKDYFAGDGINGLGDYLYESYVDVSGSGKINGTDYSDVITGSKKADTIKTGYGYDEIYAGKGNDTVIVDGNGMKTLYINKGDGNDIVKRPDEEKSNTKATREVSSGVNLVFERESERLVKAEVKEDEITYSFTKTLGDLQVTATHSDGKSESVTVKNYFDVEIPIIGGDSDFDRVGVNYNDVDDLMEESGVFVNSVKVSQILKSNPELSAMIKQLGIKIPGGLSGINVFWGSDFDDTFVGTTGRDVMIAENGNNSFSTGSKGQTVIASLGRDEGYLRGVSANGNDTYSVSSFTAGTVIADAGGENDLTINEVDVNDIHMASYMNKESENKSILSNMDIAYFTDSKGISNIEGIDYSGITAKVLPLVEAYKESGAAALLSKMKTINSLISTASDLVGKFRGVGIVAAKDEYTTETIDDEEVSVLDEKGSDILKKDITVVDKKGNEQTISVDNMAVYQDMIESRMDRYFYKISNEYAEHLAKLGFEGDELVLRGEAKAVYYGEGGISNIKDFAKYIATAPSNEKFTKADKKIYNAIKSGFFELYENAYIGTSGDNEYTITNADDGAMIVSGTGNDTFTFKGSLMNKREASKPIDVIKAISPRFSMGQTYDIVSNVRKAQPETPDTPATSADKDVINIKNYSFDDGTLATSPYQDNFAYNDDSVYFNGLSLTAVDYKKNNYATINYGIDEQFGNGYLRPKAVKYVEDEYQPSGYDVTTDTFDNLTIIDSKKKEYSVIAKYNEDSVVCNWSGDANKGKNHIAFLNSVDTTVKSNDGTNVINVSSFNYDDGNKLTYTYGGGNDTVNSMNSYSDDTYTADLDKNTKLTITDEGGDDTLNITTDASNVKLFFNVYSDGDYSDWDFQFLSSDNLKKGNFSTSSMNGYSSIVTDKGIVINDSHIETVKLGEGEAAFELATYDAADAIAEDVAAWLSASKKGYASVEDVFSRGSKSEIAQVLAIYDNVDLSDYHAQDQVLFE